MWADDLISILVQDGVGTYGTTIFKGSLANVPILDSGAAVVSVFETAGSPPLNTHNNTLFPSYTRPNAQIVIRAGSTSQAQAKAEEAYLSLYKIRNQFIGSGWYQRVSPLQEPYELGKDDRGQTRYVFNVMGVVSFGRRIQ